MCLVFIGTSFFYMSSVELLVIGWIPISSHHFPPRNGIGSKHINFFSLGTIHWWLAGEGIGSNRLGVGTQPLDQHWLWQVMGKSFRKEVGLEARVYLYIYKKHFQYKWIIPQACGDFCKSKNLCLIGTRIWLMELTAAESAKLYNEQRVDSGEINK